MKKGPPSRVRQRLNCDNYPEEHSLPSADAVLAGWTRNRQVPALGTTAIELMNWTKPDPHQLRERQDSKRSRINTLLQIMSTARTSTRLIALCMLSCFISAYVIWGLSLNNHFVSDDWVFLYKVNWHSSFPEILQFAFDLDTISGWFFRPNQWITTWTLHKLFGLRVWGYHLTSILLHSLNAFLLAALFYHLLRKRMLNSERALLYASLAALLFFINWHHHEAIFWYSAINEPLNGFFQLLSLFTLLLALVKEQRQLFLLTVATTAFLLSLFTKESASVLPIVAGALIFQNSLPKFRRKDGFRAGRLLRQSRKLLPFLLILGLWLGMYFFYLQPKEVQRITANQSRSWLVIAIGLTRYFFGHYMNARQLLSLPHDITLLIGGAVFLVALVALLRRRYVWGWAFCWTVAGIFPYLLFTPFPADRFLYTTAAPASILIVETVLWIQTELSRIDVEYVQTGTMSALYALIGIFLVVHLITLHTMESEWDTAGNIADRIISQVQNEATDIQPHTTLCLGNLPDNYRRKYVFRNGSVEALHLTYGRNDFRIRSVIQPMAESFPRQTLREEGCDYIFFYDDEARSLVTRSRP